MNPTYNKIFIIKLIILLLVLQFSENIVFPFQVAFAQNNQACDEKLEKADEAYYDGEFNRSLDLIKECLKQTDIPDEQRVRAYTILTRTFLALEKSDKAKEYIAKILEINPDYAPTIEEETPKYVNTVLLVKKEQQSQLKEDKGLNSWLWIGAGGVVATAAIIVIASSGNDNKQKKDEPLPEPPNFP